MSRQTFFQGTLILLGAGLIARLFGFIPRLILPRIIGTEGLGLYQMAFPILIFFLTIARFGLNVSVSKIVAEAEAKKDYAKIRKTLIVSVFIVLGLSILLTPIVIGSAYFLANTVFPDKRVLYPLLAMTPMIPIIAVSTIIRGYFQGKQNMIPSAISSVIESVVRIVGVVVIAILLLPYGLGMAAAGVMIGVGIGEVASLTYLALNFQRVRKQMKQPFASRLPLKLTTVRNSFKNTFKELWNISLPVTASGMIGSISYAIEPMVVAQSLMLAGISAAAATSLYGELGGLAIYLIWFPTTLTYSLSVSLVPAVSEAYAKKNNAMILKRLNQSLRLTIMIGAPFAVIFYLFAEPITLFLFNQPQVGSLLQIIAPFSLFLYFQSPLAATLQGLNMAKAAFYNSFYGAIVKTVMIFVLGSQPQLGIKGVALAINIGMTLVTILHFACLAKTIQLRLPILSYFKVISSSILMGSFGFWLFKVLSERLFQGFALMVTLTASAFLFVLLLVILKEIGKQDIVRLPVVGKYLALFFPSR